ncbi:hypothetical protein DICA3_E04764 [Diutina catenulata]
MNSAIHNNIETHREAEARRDRVTDYPAEKVMAYHEQLDCEEPEATRVRNEQAYKDDVSFDDEHADCRCTIM